MATGGEYNRFTQVDWNTKPFQPIAGIKTSENLLTITQALRHVTTNNQEVELYVKSAEEHFSKIIKPEKLTFDECAALHICTIEAGDKSLHGLLRRVLRTDDKDKLKRWLQFFRILYRAVERVPAFAGRCWRLGEPEILDKIKSERRVVWSTLNFCSGDCNYLLDKYFDQQMIVFEINAIHGKDISKYSADSNAKEILLMPGSHLEVIRIEPDSKRKNLTWVHLQELYNGLDTTGAFNDVRQESKSKDTSGRYRFFYARS